MEHTRCAQCRNPIRGRQAMVRHSRAEMTFHADCWMALHATVQADYVKRAEHDGVAALIDPYQRAEMASWLPEAAIDEAVEQLGNELVEHLENEQVSVKISDDPGDE